MSRISSALAAHMISMTTAKARQPKGIRSGGQFAETTRKEASVELTEDEKRRQERERPLTLAEVEYMQHN